MATRPPFAVARRRVAVRAVTAGADARPVLSLLPAPATAPDAGRRIVVTDTTWTPSAGDDAIALRDVAGRVLAHRDLIVETSVRLDDWADASAVAEAMTVSGTSFWYGDRLRAWLWLQETTLWLAIVDELVSMAGPRAIEVGDGIDDGLAAAARRIAARDGLAFTDDRRGGAPGDAAVDAAVIAAADEPPPPAVPAPSSPSPASPASSRGILARLRGRLHPDEATRRIRTLRRRLADLATERPHRLVVLMAHAPQLVDTPAGPRLVNAYLGPVVDRLRATALEPIEVEMRTSYSDDADWARLAARDAARRLPGDILRLFPRPGDAEAFAAQSEAVVGRLGRIDTPMAVSGVDLGPELAHRVAAGAARGLRSQLRASARAERLLRGLRPAVVLLADEYHRQDWMGAAATLGIPTAAIQHGIIYGRHNGYAHRTRPAGLRLPDRTYVFGDWERDLLVEQSVYRPDEVVVSGSPRLALVETGAVDRDAMRVELGVAPGDRMVVVSGTWGRIYRRFHYPIALACVMDRHLPRVHLVVKLHPAEPDEGPYRAVIEGAAAARGFAPPPITVVQRIDLYRLLAASDAHFGVHSTVLTEAVAAGTLNLLAVTLAGPDLLGYQAAGVAVPVRDGGDVLEALDQRDALLPGDAARQAFLDAHFRPGDAPGRIAADLLGWLG